MDIENNSELILLAIGGYSFFHIGLYLIYMHQKIKKNGRKTFATVIRIDEIEGDNMTNYNQVVEFLDGEGESVVQALDYSSSSPPSRTPPYQIPIYYLKDGYEYKIVLETNITKIVIACLLILIGASMLITCILHIFDIVNLSL